MKLAILGAPGAGKGTQAYFISKNYDIAHISTGTLLRKQMVRQTPIGKQITAIMNSGQLVPDDIAITILKNRLSAPDCKKGFLLDGFPRTLSQAEVTEEIVGVLDRVISIHVDDDVIVERMSGRRICNSCGATYHLVYKPPTNKNVCDVCNGELVQRDDDKAKTVKERLEIYHSQAEPIKDFFKKQGKLLVVSGEGEIEQITADIIKELG